MIKELFDPQLRFWNWFVKNESRIFNFDPMKEHDREQLFDELSEQLTKINPDLAFEFGPKETRREFVISAGGIKSAFGAVTALVAAAPHLERWDIIAFMPRREPCSIEIGGKRIDPHEVQCSLIHNGQKVGVLLFLPGCTDSEVAYKQIGYLFLDQALGEYDVEMSVGPIQMLAPEADTEGERFPLRDLPMYFDRLIHQLRQSPPVI